MACDRCAYFPFWTSLCPFTPLTAQNMTIKKKMEKTLEILSFYTSASKIRIICYTVPEIQCVTDVIVIFHFGLFFAHLPPNSPKNENSKKMKKESLEMSSFHTSVRKIMITCYTVIEIRHVMNVTIIFYCRLFFALLPPNSPKNENFKKMKKNTWRYHHFTHVYHKL